MREFIVKIVPILYHRKGALILMMVRALSDFLMSLNRTGDRYLLSGVRGIRFPTIPGETVC